MQAVVLTYGTFLGVASKWTENYLSSLNDFARYTTGEKFEQITNGARYGLISFRFVPSVC